LPIPRLAPVTTATLSVVDMTTTSSAPLRLLLVHSRKRRSGSRREERAMTEEPGSFDGLDAMLADAGALMSDCPQELHTEKLALGIDELAPGLVVLRRMADIQALTRSHAVRQFGGGAMEGVLTSGGEGADLGLSGHHTAIPLELNGAEHTKWR